MQDLHARAWLVYKYERITVLDVAVHLVRDDAAESIETLAHVRRMWVQEEPVCVIKAEHPLPAENDELAKYLRVDVAREPNLHAVWIDNLAERLDTTGIATNKTIATQDGDLAAPIVDADRQELTGTFRCLGSDLGLPVIEPAFLDALVGTELPNRLAALQEPLVDGPKIVNLPHNFFGS